MATSPMNAVQAALYTAITGISGLGASVYDHVPQNASMPYVRIGMDTTANNDAKATFMPLIEATIHVWSLSAGSKEAKTIAGKIYTALHRTSALSVTGFNVTECYCTFQTLMVESSHDGGDKYQHLVQRFTIQLTES